MLERLSRISLAWVLLCALVTPVFAVAPDGPQLTVQVVSRPSTSVPLGAQRVTMLTVRFTAACARDIRVSSLMVHHRALGNYRDIERVYVMVGTTRKTRTAPMTGSEGTATMRFQRFTVPACKTVTVDILADFSVNAASAGEHALAIETPADVDADAPVRIVVNPAGVAPVTTPVGIPTGTVSSEMLPILASLSYGSARTVVRMRLKADTRDDQQITAITFTNDGTARGDDLQNFVLQTSGHTRLSATVPSLESHQVRIVLDPPLIIRRNETRLLHLVADIRASRRKTVRFIIQESGDIEASAVAGR